MKDKIDYKIEKVVYDSSNNYMKLYVRGIEYTYTEGSDEVISLHVSQTPMSGTYWIDSKKCLTPEEFKDYLKKRLQDIE